MSDTQFENTRYLVVIDTAEEVSIGGTDYRSHYAVVNKQTGVVELKTPGLLDAIFFAENSDRMLENKPWEWARQTDALAEAAASGPAN